jgi:hypothetical protein
MLMRRFRMLVAMLAVASFGVAFVPAAPAQAAPYWCKAWKVAGQTWYADQSNDFNLLFTMRMSPSPSTRFSGYARYSRSDVNRGGVGSQFLSGAVSSEGVGRILMNIQWSSASSGQYNATAFDVRRTSSGGLTAGLRGTTVDTSGGGGAARWVADGWTSGLGTGDGRYHWPLFCSQANVVRYPG